VGIERYLFAINEPPPPRRAPSWRRPAAAFQHLAFHLPADGFIEAQIELANLGIEIDGPEDTGVAYSLFLNDPDGHLLELTTYYGTRKLPPRLRAKAALARARLLAGRARKTNASARLANSEQSLALKPLPARHGEQKALMVSDNVRQLSGHIPTTRRSALRFPSAHVQAHVIDDRLRHNHVDPIDAGHFHSAPSC